MGAREHSRSATVMARLKSVMPDLRSPVRWVAPRTEVGDHSKTYRYIFARRVHKEVSFLGGCPKVSSPKLNSHRSEMLTEPNITIRRGQGVEDKFFRPALGHGRISTSTIGLPSSNSLVRWAHAEVKSQRGRHCCAMSNEPDVTLRRCRGQISGTLCQLVEMTLLRARNVSGRKLRSYKSLVFGERTQK